MKISQNIDTGAKRWKQIEGDRFISDENLHELHDWHKRTQFLSKDFQVLVHFE